MQHKRGVVRWQDAERESNMTIKKWALYRIEAIQNEDS